MIDRGHALSVTKQTEAVGISRSTVYYLPRPVPAADLALMRQIDRLHMEFPFAGSRMLRRLLAANGSKVGRRHVKTLMQRMGMEALYRRPRTTKPEPGHKVFPYLLRGIEIARPNQVWAHDREIDEALGHRNVGDVHRHAADPLGGLTPADDPLIEAENLSEQVGPPHVRYLEDDLNIANAASKTYVFLTMTGRTNASAEFEKLVRLEQKKPDP